MANPLEGAQRLNQGRAAFEARLQHIHGVVWPDGRVTTHVVLPPSLEADMTGKPISRGAQVLRYLEGEVVVTKKYREQGCRLLEDVCKSDGCPERYKAWVDCARARKRKQAVVIPDLSIIYPPTVLRLRGEAAKGITGSAVWVAGKGHVSTADLKEDPEYVASLLASMGLGKPKKRGKKSTAPQGEGDDA